MTQQNKVVLTHALDITEIKTDGTFEYDQVLDLRCASASNARPVEEAVLKRLKNHFISYDQIPIANGETGPCQEVHFCETLKEYKGQTLVVADDVASTAALMGIYEIPFESKIFYVVETGKGNIVNTISPAASNKVRVSAVAG